MTEQLHLHFSPSGIGEGNGNPLQCSCLDNPRDGGAWWAAVYGVTQSRTRLKRLSSSSSSRFIGRTDAPILWSLEKSQLIRKDPDAGKDWRQEEKGTTEDKMVGWHHWLMDRGLAKLWEMIKDREVWHAAAHGVTKSQTRLSDRKTTRYLFNLCYELGWTGGLVCCDAWGRKESDTTEWLNWTDELGTLFLPCWGKSKPCCVYLRCFSYKSLKNFIPLLLDILLREFFPLRINKPLRLTSSLLSHLSSARILTTEIWRQKRERNTQTHSFRERREREKF